MSRMPVNYHEATACSIRPVRSVLLLGDGAAAGTGVHLLLVRAAFPLPTSRSLLFSACGRGRSPFSA